MLNNQLGIIRIYHSQKKQVKRINKIFLSTDLKYTNRDIFYYYCYIYKQNDTIIIINMILMKLVLVMFLTDNQ
jgi:hypothetical protein